MSDWHCPATLGSHVRLAPPRHTRIRGHMSDWHRPATLGSHVRLAPPRHTRTETLSETFEPVISARLTDRKGERHRVITVGEETHLTQSETSSVC